MKTINILPDMPAEWLTTPEAAHFIGKNVRTIQEWAQAGRIKTKPAGNKRNPRQRLYLAADLARLISTPPAEQRGGARTSQSLELRKTKPSQGDRALDTVSIVGNLVAGHKAELEMFVAQSARNLETVVGIVAKNLETVVTLMLNHHKVEAEATRERLKAEREDSRERWEIERQDRLDRRKSRAKAVAATVN